MHSNRSRQLFTLWTVVLTGFLAGCATKPTIENRAVLLSLPYEGFDQTKGSGWRPLYDERRECGKAGTVIEEYLQRHRDLKLDQRAVLHFHAAQMFAYNGNNARAVA